MFPNNGFEFKVTGTKSGLFVPSPSLLGMDNNEKYVDIVKTIQVIQDLDNLKDALFVKAYQSSIKNKDLMFNLFVVHSVMNNLNRLDSKDINGDRKVLSNSNTIFSFFPDINEYNFKDLAKVKNYPLEVNFLVKLYDKISKLNIDYGQTKELLLELILNRKNKKFQSQHTYLPIISKIKQDLLNDSELLVLIQNFNDLKVFININKQGKDGHNSIYYQSPVYITQSVKSAKDQIEMEGFKPQFQEISSLAIPSLHPVLLKKMSSVLSLDAEELFKLVRYYREAMKIFVNYKKDNLDWKIILNDLFKIQENFKKEIFVEIRQYKKEIKVKTVWYDLGKKFSKGVYSMHSSGKKDDKMYKAIASSKEELVNNLSAKKPEQRSRLIFEKYMVKFDVSGASVSQGVNPDDLLAMDAVGFHEFLIGLYIKEEV